MTSMMRTGSGGRVQEAEGSKVSNSEEEPPHTSRVEHSLTQMTDSGRRPLSSIDNAVERSKQAEVLRKKESGRSES